MEFLDEDTRPRFLFQSRSSPPSLNDPQTHHQTLNKPLICITLSLSTLVLILSLFFLQNEPFKSLFIWVSLSLLLGPFAPSQLTGGDVRVGHGPILEPPHPQSPPKKPPPPTKKRSKPVRSDEFSVNGAPIVEKSNGSWSKVEKIETLEESKNGFVEMGWNEEDFEVLKKQLVKHPVGKPQRWEAVAEAFRGRHGVESVIKKAKEMGERRSDDGDSFARFLKNRKPLDLRIQEGSESEGVVGRSDNGSGVVAVGWSAGEDIALLNALKAFPKDVATRWEKIAVAVPGRSKAACIKRVAELKRDFRSSKAGADG